MVMLNPIKDSLNSTQFIHQFYFNIKYTDELSGVLLVIFMYLPKISNVQDKSINK